MHSAALLCKKSRRHATAIQATEDEAADREGEDDAHSLVLVPVRVILDADVKIEASQSVFWSVDISSYKDDSNYFFALDLIQSSKCH